MEPGSEPRLGPGAWALFLDFDGTLVDLAPTPDAVTVPPGLPGLLRALKERLGGAVAIVTGRPLADVDAFLPGLELDGCGLHGLERRWGGNFSRPVASAPLSTEVEALRRLFAGAPGIVIEDKGVSVAIHWRLAPALETEAAAAAADLAARLGPAFRIQDGKAVREIVPADAGKGAGVRALMARPPYAGRRPLFAGDDRTDEDGFEAAAALGGLAVKVGPGPTRAARRIASSGEFRMWLTAFLASPDAVDRLSLA